MPDPVKDPAVLAAFDQPGPAPVTDPTITAQFDQPSMQHPNSTPELPLDKLPFGDQASLSALTNIKEYELYLGHRYGKDNVTQEFDSNGNPNVVVKAGGKTYRIGPPGTKGQGPSFIATIAGDFPEIAGSIIGAGAGVEGGPVGMIAGAGIGAMAGHTYKMGIKAARDEYAASPTEGLDELGIKGVEGMGGEAGGAVIGKGVAKVLTGRLPKFITGATDESIAKTKLAHEAGALPNYASMGPDLMHLRRIEVVGEKLAGKNKRQQELNMAYVRSHLRETLTDQGYPRAHIDEFMESLDSPELAVSNQNVGKLLQDSVKAHVQAMTDSIGDAAKTADSHIDAQVNNLRENIERSKSGDLTGDFGKAYESAHKDFTGQARELYDKAHELVGGRRIVPMDQIKPIAAKIAQEIRETAPSQVNALTRDLSAKVGRQLTEDDAILMHEFGIEIPEGEGKVTLQAAQRLRTILRQKAGAGDLQHNATQHDYGELANAVDRAIDDARADPAARQAVEALDVADDFWKRNVRKFDDTKLDNLVKQIRSGAAPSPGALVKSITNAASSQKIARIRSVVGEDVWKQVQAEHMDKYLRRFAVKEVDGTTKLDGFKMLSDLEDGDPDALRALRTVHGAESVGQLREIAKMIATRRGQLDPAVLRTGDVKAALQDMKAREAKLDEFMKSHALKILADDSQTGEQAYQWLARGHGNGGNEQRIAAVVEMFGKDSPQVLGLRQAMLEEIARNARTSTILDKGNSAIEKALQQYSKTQLAAVFPPDFAKDMNKFNDVIKFMFPFQSGAESDVSMAGMATGHVQSHGFIRRTYEITVAGVMRFIVLHPGIARTLVTGRDEGQFQWQRSMAKVFKQIARSGFQAETERQATPEQPKIEMPAPGTLQ